MVGEREIRNNITRRRMDLVGHILTKKLQYCQKNKRRLRKKVKEQRDKPRLEYMQEIIIDTGCNIYQKIKHKGN